MSIVTGGLGSAPSTFGWGWWGDQVTPELGGYQPVIEAALVLAPSLEAALGEPAADIAALELAPDPMTELEQLEAELAALELAPDPETATDGTPEVGAKPLEGDLEAAPEAAPEVGAQELAPEQDAAGDSRPENVESLHITPDPEEGD